MSSPSGSFDHVDRALLEVLQRDGRATVGQLAERVSLSPSPCWRRVRQLEESGVISGYHAHLDRRRIGYGVLGFVQLNLHDHTSSICAAFEREVLAPDLEYFAAFVRSRIRSLPGVRQISTSFSLKEIKRTIALPLDH